MFKQSISVSINDVTDKQACFDGFEMLLAAYHDSGQVVGDYEPPFIDGHVLQAYVTTLEKSSLSPKHNNEYVSGRLKLLRQLCGCMPKAKLAGRILNEQNACNCQQPGHYVLFTHVLQIAGPIECGGCGGVVPLYRVPRLTDYDKRDILSWQHDYKSCDALQLNCTVGEKWATKQMSDPQSQLSREGLKIRKTIEGATGVRTYYYLYNYRNISIAQDMKRNCPSCNRKWLLKEPIAGFYHFKCDRCRLLSSLSPARGGIR